MERAFQRCFGGITLLESLVREVDGVEKKSGHIVDPHVDANFAPCGENSTVEGTLTIL